MTSPDAAIPGDSRHGVTHARRRRPARLAGLSLVPLLLAAAPDATEVGPVARAAMDVCAPARRSDAEPARLRLEALLTAELAAAQRSRVEGTLDAAKSARAEVVLARDSVDALIRESGGKRRVARACEPVLARLDEAMAPLDDLVRELMFWTSAWAAVDRSWDPGALADFAERWPAPPYGPIALDRIRIIGEEQAWSAEVVAPILEPGVTEDAIAPACARLAGEPRDLEVPATRQARDGALARCTAWGAASAALRSSESKNAPGEPFPDAAEIARLAESGPTNGVKSRASVERGRRRALAAGCTPQAMSDVVLAPGPDIAVFARLQGGIEGEGWLRAPDSLRATWRCSPLPGATVGPDAALPVFAVEDGDNYGLAVAVPIQRETLGRALVREEAVGIEPCHLNAMGHSNAYRFGMDHGSETTATWSGSKLSVVLEITQPEDDGLEASFASLMTAPLGLGVVTRQDLQDVELMRLAMCFAARLAETARSPREKPAARESSERLQPTALPMSEVMSMRPTAWAEVSALTIEVRLLQAQEKIDQYGVRRAAPGRRLRTGRLTVGGERLLRNDWSSIAGLVDDASPMIHTAKATAVFRRYVDAWTVW